MKSFKQYLDEVLRPIMPLSRAEIEEIKAQLLFYAKQHQPKPVHKPIVFKRVGMSAPAGYTQAFYIRLQGDEKSVGTVSKEPLAKGNGVAYVLPDVLLPDFAYYYFMNLHQQGTWRAFATGSTGLKHLSLKDLNSLKFAQR